jgi:hypothetical protein
MARLPPDPSPSGAPSPRDVGRVSKYLGERLLMVGLVSGAAGLVLLIFAAVKVWLAISRGRVGNDAAQMVVAAALAVALLSVGRGARRTGLT